LGGLDAHADAVDLASVGLVGHWVRTAARGAKNRE
jgi:hypothetical protein